MTARNGTVDAHADRLRIRAAAVLHVVTIRRPLLDALAHADLMQEVRCGDAELWHEIEDLIVARMQERELSSAPDDVRARPDQCTGWTVRSPRRP